MTSVCSCAHDCSWVALDPTHHASCPLCSYCVQWCCSFGATDRWTGAGYCLYNHLAVRSSCCGALWNFTGCHSTDFGIGFCNCLTWVAMNSGKIVTGLCLPNRESLGHQCCCCQNSDGCRANGRWWLDRWLEFVRIIAVTASSNSPCFICCGPE